MNESDIMRYIKLFSFFSILLFAASIAYASVVEDVNESDPSRIGVTVTEIENRVKALSAKEKDGTIGSEEQSSLDDYRNIQESNKIIIDTNAKFKRIEGFVNLDLNNNKYLKEHNEFFKELEKDRKTLKKITSQDLVLLIAKYTAKRDSFNAAYQKFKSYHDNSNNYIKDATSKVGELSNLILENNIKLKETDVSINESQYLSLKALNTRYTSEINMIQFVLNNSEISYKNMTYILGLKQEMAEECSRFLDGLVILQNDLRKNELQETKELVDEVVKNSGEHPALSMLSNENNQLQNLIEEVNDENNEIVSDNNQLLNLIEEAKKFDSDIDNQIHYFKGSFYLAKILSDPTHLYRKFAMPDNFVDKTSERQMLQYTNKTKLDSLDVFSREIRQKYSKDFEENRELEALVDKNIKIRERLITELNTLLNNYTRNAINLQINNENYTKLQNNLRLKTDNAMFWNPSNSGISKRWFKELRTKRDNGELFYAKIIHSLYFKHPSSGEIFRILMLMIFLSVVIYFCGIFREKKEELGKYANKISKTGYIDVPICLFADVMAGFKFAVITFIVGYIQVCMVGVSGSEDSMIHGALIYVALSISLLVGASVFFSKFYSAGGVNERYFGIPYNQKIYKSFMRIFFVICVIGSIVLWRTLYPKMFSDDYVGQFITMVLSAYIAYEFIYMFVVNYKNEEFLLRKKFALAIAIGTCLSLVVITYMGYYYSSVRVYEKFIVSLYIVLTYDLLRSLIKRTIKVVANKIRLKQKMAEMEQNRKKAEAEGVEAGSESPENIDDYILDKSSVMNTFKISEQAVSIIDNIFVLLLVIILYKIWGDLLTVTSYLKNYILYKVGSGDAGRAITLFDFMLVFYNIVLATVLVKNLPGAIQVFILNRFASLQKYSYSVTTIISYLLIAFSVLFCASSLGIGWDKVQWLVAALSVGLGFGLQEIFANFISGIIILFERPVRIGDIITINDHSGTVSKIRIRATTIVDFDLKEYVIPNRSLITSSLTNWTLRDTVTRVVIKIGVGYGSDMDEVKALLYEIADRNPYVVKVPNPKVYFMEFADSNLNIDFYLYTSKIADRYPCIDTINSDILKTFREHDIEIAFNQMDIFVKNLKDGTEAKLETIGGDARPKA